MARSLEQLLRNADLHAGDAPNIAGLAGRVRRTAARRRTTRRVLGAASGVIAMVFAVSALLPSGSKMNTLPVGGRMSLSTAEVFDLQNEVELLRRETDEREQQALAWIEAERTARVRKVQPSPAVHTLDPLDEVFLQRDRAASILVQSGDRMAKSPTARASAIEEYRRAIELFPQTPWAAQARQRLQQMQG